MKNDRVGFVLVLVLSTLAPSLAVAGGIDWGVKGGLAGASLRATTDFHTAADSGLAVGAFVGIGLSERVRFQPEVLWTNRRFSSTDERFPFGIAARGVEVPLLFQLMFIPDGRLQPVFYAGPQLSFVSKVTQALDDSEPETDISDQVKGLDAGVTFGGGVETDAGRGAIVLEGRVNLGLRDLAVASDSRFKSLAFFFLVGYRF